MSRILVVMTMALALTSAIVLYAVKYDTRTLEAEVQATERAIDAARRDISVMEAERAHLSNPERIGPLARDLGLVPVTAGQITSALPGVGEVADNADVRSAAPRRRTP